MQNAGLTHIAIDTASIANGASIASYLVDAAGTLLTSTLSGGKQALDVNLAASDIGLTANIEGDYAEDTAHVTGDRGLFTLSVRNDNQTTTLTSASGDYAPFATDAKGALYTKNILNGGSLQQVVTVGTTATALPTTPLTNRASMFVQMLSGGKLFLGSATVTNAGATRGFLLSGNGAFATVDAGPGNLVYGVCDGAGKDVLVWEMA